MTVKVRAEDLKGEFLLPITEIFGVVNGYINKVVGLSSDWGSVLTLLSEYRVVGYFRGGNILRIVGNSWVKSSRSCPSLLSVGYAPVSFFGQETYPSPSYPAVKKKVGICKVESLNVPPLGTMLLYKSPTLQGRDE